MEILIILILILLGIILPIKIFKPTLVLLAAAATFLGGTITLPYITQITGNTVTYETLDPLIAWALGIILIISAVIMYLDQMDTNEKQNKSD